MTAEIELAFRRAARTAADHTVELWEADWQIAMRLGDRAVIPDARIVYRVGNSRCHMFIETDLGSEGTRFFARKIGRYVELYEGGAWREFIRVWPRIVTVTLTEVRAASLHRATEALLNSRYLYSRPLSAYFLSIDALRACGLSAPCYAVSIKERPPLLDVAELARHDMSATTPSTSARSDEASH